eukprot:m.214898 g.214898  ORF g.214898 m.214898 type:complete len:445 (-) comp33179_c1_seq1:48-1382(-)
MMFTKVLIASLVLTTTGTTDIETKCTTTAATASGTAAGADCAVPFWENSTQTMHYEALDDGLGGKICPVAVGQRNRTQDDMNYWAAATCMHVRCWVNGSSHDSIPVGTPCVFPYIDRGVLRRGCLSDSQWGEAPWCPIEVDEDGNYPYGMYGTCACINSSIAPPPPTPPPGAPTMVPQDDDDDNNGSGQQGAPADTGMIFAGVGGTAAGLAIIVLLGVVYRRARVFKTDFSRDLASPRRFKYNDDGDRKKSKKHEREGLLSSSRTGATYDSFISNEDSFDAMSQASVGPPLNLVEDVVPVLAPQTPPRSSTAQKQASRNSYKSNQQQKPTMDSTPTFSQEIGPSAEEIDWAAMEEAAAKLRTCRIVKGDGEKIGMRLLNYLGPNFAGVKIVGVHPDSPAAKGGVKEGDSIVEINNAPIINLYHQEVIELLASSGKSFDIIVCRD